MDLLIVNFVLKRTPELPWSSPGGSHKGKVKHKLLHNGSANCQFCFERNTRVTMEFSWLHMSIVEVPLNTHTLAIH